MSVSKDGLLVDVAAAGGLLLILRLLCKGDLSAVFHAFVSVQY